MERRADRVIAITALAAIALVPSVLVAAVSAGEITPRAPGAMPAAQIAGDYGPARGRTPSPLPVPTSTVRPARPAELPPAPPGGGQLPKPPKPIELVAYSRGTESKYVRLPTGGRQQVTENSAVRMGPAFTVHSQGKYEHKVQTVTELTPIELTVERGVMSVFDGETWERTRLSKDGLALTKAAHDPRSVTFAVASQRGARRTGPDGRGLTTFTARTTLGKVTGFIPPDMLGDLTKDMPPSTPVDVLVRADKNGFARLFTISGHSAKARLAVRSTFTGYRFKR